MEYFTQEFLTEIVTSTNQASLMSTGTTINISSEEFIKFIALEIMTGSIGYPRLKMYRSKATEIPYFRHCMSRSRFHSLRNNLKFTSSSNTNDKLYKEDPTLDNICPRNLLNGV